MDLLTNAIESIQVGVEDYKSGTRPRLLSAVRNIHSGILLLYKEALHRLSPPDSADALIASKIMPTLDKRGQVTFVGIGKKTVDVHEIQGRFSSLGIKTNWNRFMNISGVRNDLEHRYPQIDQKALSGLISDSFLIIRDFVKDELEDNPRGLLGEVTWQTMLEVTEVYDREKAESTRLLNAVKWNSLALQEGVAELNCEKCGSDLLKPQGGVGNEIILECISCGSLQGPDEYASRAIHSALSGEAYRTAKDGGESPYAICPECGQEAYVMDEDQCAACGESVQRECSRCGEAIPAEELDSSPFCGYCAHMIRSYLINTFKSFRACELGKPE